MLLNIHSLLMLGGSIFLADGSATSKLGSTSLAEGSATYENQPIDRRSYKPIKAPRFSNLVSTPQWNWTYKVGFLAAGYDLHNGMYTYDEASAFCGSNDNCAGFTFNHGDNNDTQPSIPVNVYFKTVQDYSCCDAQWATYLKAGPEQYPDINFTVSGLSVGLRPLSHSIQLLNIVDDTMPPFNFSFVPPLKNFGRSDRSLPGCHQLGDITLRLQPLSETNSTNFAFFSSSWAGFLHSAIPLPASGNVFAIDDITPLLNATPAEDQVNSSFGLTVKVIRSYEKIVDPVSGEEALLMRFNLTALQDVRIGGLGMSLPADDFFDQDLNHIAFTNSLIDPHIGNEHSWAEWIRIVGNYSLYVFPGDRATVMEAWRPLMEDCNYNGAMNEWVVLSGSWSNEWEKQTQAPNELFMAQDLANLGVWPDPKSPWPSFKGNQTVWVPGLNEKRAWNKASVLELTAGQTASYSLKFVLAPAGGSMRARDQVFSNFGEPILHAVPGYTIATDMNSTFLLVQPPRGSTVTSASVSPGQESFLSAAVGGLAGNGYTIINIQALAPGQARLELTFSDGSHSVAHYRVLQPLSTQVANFGNHLSNIAWLPRDYPDPFGRSASVMPYDREDSDWALDDARAYIVGLSDDAGAAQNLAHAMKVAWAPIQDEVTRKDDYVKWTLYGVKPDTAKEPLRSLQIPDTYQVRMTTYYYCATPGTCTDSGEGWAYSYPEQNKCDAPVGGPVWCMTENMANATYRGFNFPHQAATWYALYRVARNFDQISTYQSWDFYLYGAFQTALGVGQASVGFMDGTIFREILVALQTEGALNATIASWAATLNNNMQSRAVSWSQLVFPYGSEFAYDTTGQEEVYVWLQHFGYIPAANNTLNSILAYMRLLPNWVYHGGATSQGDLGNNGKWFINRGGERMLMHYRAGLNNIPIAEGYRYNPDDFFLLETSIGALTGQLANIDATGAPSMGFHSSPFVLEYDPRSGDFGCGFFGITLEASSTLVNHPTLGWLCYLCNLGVSTQTFASYSVVDSYRVRTFLEPIGAYLIAEAGNLMSLSIDLVAKSANITFAPASSSPASVHGHDGGLAPFSFLRLNVTKTAPNRPGNSFMASDGNGNSIPIVRGAFQVAPNGNNNPTTIKMMWS